MVDVKDGIVLQPRSDKREYRWIQLENGLQALLICDPETDKVRNWVTLLVITVCNEVLLTEDQLKLHAWLFLDCLEVSSSGHIIAEFNIVLHLLSSKNEGHRWSKWKERLCLSCIFTSFLYAA
jgi:hypothetical protein